MEEVSISGVLVKTKDSINIAPNLSWLVYFASLMEDD